MFCPTRACVNQKISELPNCLSFIQQSNWIHQSKAKILAVWKLCQEFLPPPPLPAFITANSLNKLEQFVAIGEHLNLIKTIKIHCTFGSLFLVLIGLRKYYPLCYKNVIAISPRRIRINFQLYFQSLRKLSNRATRQFGKNLKISVEINRNSTRPHEVTCIKK